MPPPRGTTGTPCWLAQRIVAATSAAPRADTRHRARPGGATGLRVVPAVALDDVRVGDHAALGQGGTQRVQVVGHCVSLDQQGSIVRTASVLHLHRNAVTYRLRRITDLLGVDLDDPDQRLALQLACRARLLA